MKTSLNCSKIGTSLICLAALFPFSVSSSNYISLVKKTGFALPDNLQHAITHISNTNLLATSVSLFVFALIGYKKKEKWIWSLLLFLVVWVGLNDSFAVYWLYKEGKIAFPLPIVPTSLSLLGLGLCFRHYFPHSRNMSQTEAPRL